MAPTADAPAPLHAALLRLARLDKARLDEALSAITEIASDALGVARVSVWLREDGSRVITCADVWDASQQRHDRRRQVLAEGHPGYFESLERHRTVAATDARRDPRARALTANSQVPLDVTGLLDVPVWRGGEVVGVLCLEHVGRRHAWTASEVEFGVVVAEAVAQALEASERVAALTALRRERARLDQILRQLPVGVLIVDRDGRISYGNEAAAAILGEPVAIGADLEGFCAGRLARPDDTVFMPGEPAVTRALRSGEAVHDEDLWVQRRDGTWVALSAHAAPLRDNGSDVVGGIATFLDITERRRAEAGRDEDARLRERMMSILGHDLRTPLAAITMLANDLQRRAEGAWQEHAARIERSARRMSRMICDLVDAARVHAGAELPLRRVPLDLARTCREVLDELTPAWPDRHLELTTDGDLWGAFDPDRVAQVLSNLVRNAVVHGADGTPVRVRVQGEADVVVLRVHNEGPPIDPALLPELFLPPRDRARPMTTHFDGLGIGLSIVGEIVRAHGGDVRAVSTERDGTTLTIRLPRSAK